MDKNKKKILLQALANNDKDKLRQAIAKTLPDKWVTYCIDHEEGTIKYGSRIISKEEADMIIQEARKDFNVRLTLMHWNRDEDQSTKEEWDFGIEPEIAVIYVKAGPNE